MSAVPLSSEQVLSLAPDASSAKAGAALAAARKWTGLGGDGEGRVVWGLCQGSGTQPYRTQVDLADVASRCSCPSRKFPCKHALGLMLLLAAEPELFAVGEPPAWVAEWLADRVGRAERKRERETSATEGASEADGGKARERRTTARAGKVAAGLVELARWLEDLTRGGLAASASRPATFWETAAARLVDAQAPGAARLVRQLASIPATGADWPERMVAAVARLHLLAEAYARLPELPAPLQADVRAAVGWSAADTEPDDARAIADEWTVLGHVVEEEERLRARRTWLAGRRSGRHALLLHFAHGAAPFAEPVPPAGGMLAAEVAFLPGSAPLRAAVRTLGAPVTDDAAALPAGHARIADALGAWAATLAANPWTERVALVLAAAVPEPHGERWRVRDADGDVLPLAPRFHAGWPLLALSGGHPVWIAGEWDGDALLPLSASDGGRLLSLTQPVAHTMGASA